MVVFTCNHCGETLHKPKVDKHYQFTCRNYKSVTCVDCFKDFKNEEYVAHTKCVTEDERYAAKGTYKNGIVKKGEVKQDSWLEMIKSICESESNLKPSIKNLLNTVAEYSNVPRKKQKFMNFIRSSSGNRANMKEVEEVWDIIEKYKAKNKPNNQKTLITKKADIQNEVSNATLEPETQDRKRSINNKNSQDGNLKKKKKSSEETEDNSPNCLENSTGTSKKQKLKPFEGTKEMFGENNEIEVSAEAGSTKKNKKNKQNVSDLEKSVKQAESLEDTIESSFNFKEKILEILKGKQSISHKKLQKKIIKAFINATGDSNCEEKVIKKFNKKLKKIPNVGIEDDRVVLQ